MASFVGIHVKSSSVEQIKKKIIDYYSCIHPKSSYDEIGKDVEYSKLSEAFNNNDNVPTLFLMGQGNDGYIHILYNSWNKVEELCQSLSTENKVFLVQVQTTSSVFLLDEWDEGKLQLSFSILEGELKFEVGHTDLNQPENNEMEEEEDFDSYDWYSLKAYCNQQGLEPWSETVKEFCGIEFKNLKREKILGIF